MDTFEGEAYWRTGMLGKEMSKDFLVPNQNPPTTINKRWFTKNTPK